MISNKKHAFLILCHNNFQQLLILIKLLDYRANDIYIHVDKKTKNFPFETVKNTPSLSSVFFVKRIKVSWGGFSQIKAELELLKASIIGNYQYYHLISGADLPLHTQEEIHSYFDKNYGQEFMRADDISEEGNMYVEQRLKTYHFFREIKKRSDPKSILSRAERFSLKIQNKMRIDRTKNAYKYYFGDQWFSITHNLAQFVLDHEKSARKYFKFTSCSDEIFMQTLAMMSPYADNIIGHSARLIDWNRGRPYTFRKNDFDELIHSPKMFARKFDENIDNDIIHLLYDYLITANET